MREVEGEGRAPPRGQQQSVAHLIHVGDDEHTRRGQVALGVERGPTDRHPNDAREHEQEVVETNAWCSSAATFEPTQ